MHPPLDEWDAAYLSMIATPDESGDLEKKGSAKFDPFGDKKETRAELAKQVCAFGNSGLGFLVYGIASKGGLDAGVQDAVGAQPVKAWIEAEIPRLLQPPFNGCQARLIHVLSHHAPGRGALVVEIPLSQLRPHWIPGNIDVAYIRAGEHSYPMKHQTLLDIASRTDAAEGVIDSLGLIDVAQESGGQLRFVINPVVRLLTGPVCREWGFDLRINEQTGALSSAAPRNVSNVRDEKKGYLSFLGSDPLIPGRPTLVSSHIVWLNVNTNAIDDAHEVVATLYAGAAQPVIRKFSINELKQSMK
jgi:Schlafen, AlbA_2